MGKFKDMLMATAKSPAMLVYLDNFQSTSPDAKAANAPRQGQGIRAQAVRRVGIKCVTPISRAQLSGLKRRLGSRNRTPGINENYGARNQEFTRWGLKAVTLRRMSQEVARCFTAGHGSSATRTEFAFREWMARQRRKDRARSDDWAAGGGRKDGERVIEILLASPTTARVHPQTMWAEVCQRHTAAISSRRVASVYQKTGGDIRDMLRTIFAAPEFYSKDAYRAKIKSPLELAVSAVRALGGEMSFHQQTAQFIAKMGQPLYLYQAPTGYPDRADQWVNTGSLLERLNYGLALSMNKLRGASVDVRRVAAGADMSDTPGPATCNRHAANGEFTPRSRVSINRNEG